MELCDFRKHFLQWCDLKVGGWVWTRNGLNILYDDRTPPLDFAGGSSHQNTSKQKLIHSISWKLNSFYDLLFIRRSTIKTSQLNIRSQSLWEHDVKLVCFEKLLKSYSCDVSCVKTQVSKTLTNRKSPVNFQKIPETLKLKILNYSELFLISPEVCKQLLCAKMRQVYL